MASSCGNYYSDYKKHLEMQQNLKYKKKYKKLKRIIKDTVIENAALCDQVSTMQENLVLVKEERLFLLRKLYQLQGEMEASSMAPKLNANHSNVTMSNNDGVMKKSTKRKYCHTDLGKWKQS